MKILQVKHYDEMSQKAAELLIDRIRRSPGINLGLATGGTPVGLYAQMVNDHQKNHTSYRDVTTFNLDEYMGLSGEDPNSYRLFMDKHLFNHIDIQKSNTHVPIGDTDNPNQQCSDYENLIERHGGIDLQVLGIGSNGHIGFNEPGTSFHSETHIVELTPSTREANARYFNSLNEVPSHAISMGIASIMRSREIVLLVSGDAKRDALEHLLQGDVNESFPASILKTHPAVTIIADEAAIGKTLAP
ncbi:glucosamine-6-phosphate deaminase [Sporosarcina globispora]|uniref:Glucosamine-6-phosphate deaminase n=1 Tax=Sporosarcina globispora TaxID=1459 RepID=A0A0M0G7I9_SPOGL|nr:glucosamine-6-phosphate deaminase [Sporosarcina globispora]KON85462.1 glucosamine-6-phosphate deaminase [Sporosarcina globispora]